MKGKTAFGCSNYKNGCNFKIAFEQFGKKLTDKQILALIRNKKSPIIKNLIINNQAVEEAMLTLDSSLNIQVQKLS